MASRSGIPFAFAALALALALLAASGAATAHADFISSSPEPYAIWNIMPSSVRVTVSEAVQPGSQKIIVTNLTGVEVDDRSTQLSATDPSTIQVGLIGGLGPSVFTVAWAVVSADDGHFTAGTFYFMVTYRDGTLPGQFPRTGTLVVDQPISPVDVALEGANFVGFSIAFGAILLVGLLWAPLGSSLEATDRTGPVEGFRALLRFARLGAAIFTIAVAGLWLGNLLRVPPSGPGGLVGSTFLLVRVLQIAIGGALVVLLTNLLSRTQAETAFSELPWEFLPLIFLGFITILMEVAASHSTTIDAWWPLGPIADAVHLYGAALWVGGLLAIVRARHWLRAPTPAAFSRDLLAGFSRFAFLGALLLVSAGALLGVILIGTVNGLLGTAYGWIVLGKGALLVPMVGLGAWNRRTLRRVGADEEIERSAVDRLARNVRLEAILGAVVLTLAGLLVTINPAAAPQPQNPTFLLESTNGGLHGIFEMDPYPSTPQSYFFQLTLYYAANGTPFLAGGNGTLTFLAAGGNATGVTVPLEGPHANHYFVQSAAMNAPGTWDVEANVRGPTGASVSLSFTVLLHS